MSRSDSTFLWAAEAVLKKYQRPMSAGELVEYALENGFFSDKLFGLTPERSMQARISVDIRKRGNQSKFVRTAPGRFFLRSLLDNRNVYLSGAPPLHSSKSGSGQVRLYDARRRKPSSPKERVLVIPRGVFSRYCRFQGIHEDPEGARLSAILAPGNYMYLPRIQAEESDDYKQIITYVLVRKRESVLSFRRGVFNRAAAFLRGSRCIGFGGHVNEQDRSIFSISDAGVSQSALRELTEEVDADEKLIPEIESHRLKFLGILNDDSSEIGRRHLAVVYEYNVEDRPTWSHVRKGEASINQLSWIDIDKDRVDLNDFEYWSQLCWRIFFPNVCKTQPAYKILRKTPFRKNHLLAVVGTIGSGKSAATRVFTEQHDYAQINSRVVLANLIGIPPIPQTSREKFQQLAWSFINRPSGPRDLAKALERAALDTAKPKVVIDGIRQRETLEILKRLWNPKPLATIYVHAAPDVAYKFYRLREKDTGGRVTHSRFMALYTAAVETEVSLMISDADAVLYNWEGHLAFTNEIDKFIEAVSKQ